MSVALKKLKPFFSDGIGKEDEKKLDKLFERFKSDFFDESILIDGTKFKVKIHPYNPRKDNLPSFYGHYYEKFVHLITRKQNRKRFFEEERANRIHWIKPILEHRESPLISHFKFRESDGNIRDYLWYKNKKYMVIIQKITSEYILITGFCVDEKNKLYYLRKEMNKIE